MNFSCTPSTQQKIAELNSSGRGPRRLTDWLRDKGLPVKIAELAETNELGLLPELLPHCLDNHPSVAAAANAAVTKLLNQVTPSDFFYLDIWIRDALWSWQRGDNAWSLMNASRVQQLHPDCSGALFLASMHPSGRVREAALWTLALVETGDELPLLLLRLNDWVLPIRETARKLLRKRCQVVYASHFIRFMPLLLRVEKGLRAEHKWLLSALSELFLQEGTAEALQDGLSHADRKVRQACLNFACIGSSQVARSALMQALHDVAPEIRLWAAKQLLSQADDETLLVLSERLQRDYFMPVRRELLCALVERNTEGKQAALTVALLDKHRSMREMARFYLRGSLDVAGYYRDVIGSKNLIALVPALLGLSECGDKTDAKLAAPWLVSPEIRIRRAAVIATGRLAASTSQAIMLEALTDAAPSVSAAAMTVLLDNSCGITDELEQILKSHSVAFVRKNALKVICRLTKWERLPLLLVACRDDCHLVVALATTALHNWRSSYNRSQLSPRPAQLAKAEEELRLSTLCFAPRFVTELQKMLESHGSGHLS